MSQLTAEQMLEILEKHDVSGARDYLISRGYDEDDMIDDEYIMELLESERDVLILASYEYEIQELAEDE